MRYLIIASAAITLVLSTSLNAATISYNGYSLDTDTNIVTGGGLDWIQWDETAGLSINDALASNSGWRLATTAEVESLFGSFNYFGATTVPGSFDNFALVPNTNDVLNFIQLFGDSYLTPSALSGDLFSEQATTAIFASDLPGVYNAAIIEYNADGRLAAVGDNTLVTLEYAISGADSAGGYRGVALVQTSVVPVPAAVWLFGSGLIGLAGIARRKKA